MSDNVFRDKRFYKKKMGFMAMRQETRADQDEKDSVSERIKAEKQVEDARKSDAQEAPIVQSDDSTEFILRTPESAPKPSVFGWGGKKRRENETT